MNTLDLFVFTIAGIIVYLMIVDEVFANFFYISLNLLLVNIKRCYYIILFHPKNPLSNWWFEYRMREHFKNDDNESIEKEESCAVNKVRRSRRIAGMQPEMS